MENGEEEPPPDYGQAILKASEIMAQIQLQQTQNLAASNRVTFLEFLEYKPCTFEIPKEPFDADDWLLEMNKIFEVAHVANEDLY